jgi:hypothetical protein
MSAKSAIAFFLPPPQPKAKAKATPRRPGLTQSERSAVNAYLKADRVERKSLLRADKLNSGQVHTPETRRAWRKAYMRRYRSRKRIVSIIL